MTITLRPYQEQMIADVRAAMREHRNILLQAPTGAGKTAITVFMMSRAAAVGRRAYFLVHQNELLSQTSRALWRQKLEHGMIAAGRAGTPLPAQVASIQTLIRRIDRYPEPDLIIIDEAHRAAAKTYRDIIAAWPNARVIGLTATPQRTDGKPLDVSFDHIVHGPSICDLIEQGYLCRYELFAPPSAIDLTGVKTQMGDYARDDLAAAMDKPTITGDAVAHYMTHARGKRCVVMCVTIEHAEHVAAQYRGAGVAAEVIAGHMTDVHRTDVLERLERGTLHVIASVQLLVEGVDIPGIEVVQWLRPTKSLVIWMQGNGRGLRPAPGKSHLTILDHVGNSLIHGLPDEDREWSLAGRDKRPRASSEQDVKICQCKKCWIVFRPGPTQCPSCGEPVAAPSRQIEQVDGALVKIDTTAIERIRKQARIEQGRSKTLDELIHLGIRKQMKNPWAWAANIVCARAGRKPSQRDYADARRAHAQIVNGGNASEAAI